MASSSLFCQQQCKDKKRFLTNKTSCSSSMVYCLPLSLFCWYKNSKNLAKFRPLPRGRRVWLAKFPHLEFCASQFSFFLSVYLCVFDFLFISHYFMHHTNNVVCSNSMTPADKSTFESQVCPKTSFLNLCLCNFSGTRLFANPKTVAIPE